MVDIKNKQTFAVRLAGLTVMTTSILGSFLPSFNMLGLTVMPFRIVFPLFIILIFARASISQNEFRLYSAFIPLSVLLIIGLFSIILTNQVQLNYRDLLLLFVNLLLLVSLAISLSNRTTLLQAWSLLGGLCLLAIFISSFEIYTGWHLPYSQMYNRPDSRFGTFATAWYHGVNSLSLFLSISSIYWFVNGVKKHMVISRRIAYLTPWVLSVIINAYINGRSGLLAMGAAATCSILLIYRPNSVHIQRLDVNRLSMLFSLLLSSALSTVFILAENPFTYASSLWTRWQLQKVSIVEGRILGNGFGTASSSIRQSMIDTGGTTDPHSWFGSLIIETGITGLIMFLLFYIILALGGISLDVDNKPTQVMCIAALVALPIAALGPGNAFYFRDFWTLLALPTANYMINN